MPVTLSTPTIPNTEIKLRWKEQYGSSGMNKKFFGIIPAGIYRGFTLGTSGTNNAVTVNPDSTYQDHIVVCQSIDGFSTTFRDANNTIYTLDLSNPALLSQTLVITFFITYEEGQTTSAAFTIYTLAEWTALSAAVQGELIVLGTVVNVAGGMTIPSPNITTARRTLAINSAASLLQFPGGPNWADGTTNPATSDALELIKIISDLAGSTGTGKIQGSSSTYVATATLANQLVQIAGFVHDDRPPNEASIVPLRTWRDWQGNVRATIDHNGYPSGDYTQVIEDWSRGGLISQSVPIQYGFASAGSQGSDYTRSAGLLVLLTTSAVWQLPVGGIPDRASLQNVILNHDDDVNGNNYVVTVSSTTPSSAISAVSKTIGTNIGYTQDDVFALPSSGSGPMIVTAGEFLNIRVDLSSATALQNYRVYDFLIKYIVDPSGWFWSGVTGNNLTTGDARNYLDPPTGFLHTFDQRSVQIVTGCKSGGPDGSSTLSSQNFTRLNSFDVIVQEWDVSMGVITDVANAASFDLGLRFDTTILTAHWDSGVTTWKLRFKAGASPATDVDTGVTVTSDVYRMRMELLGGLMNSTGQTKVNLYINGALVATNHASFTSTSFKINSYFNASTNASGAAAGPYDMRIGPVRRTWNHIQSGDDL